MLQCWAENRGDRPSFSHITQIIDGWIRSPETMQEENDTSLVIGEWLQSIKMGNYVSHFIAAGYENLSQLSNLKDEDLKALGINLIGHRNKILKAIYALPAENKR